MASSDLYANVTDVDNPTYDIVLAPGDPSVFGTDPGIIISWWNGDNVWTKKRDGWQASDPESFNKLQSIMDEAVQLDGDAAKAKWGRGSGSARREDRDLPARVPQHDHRLQPPEGGRIPGDLLHRPAAAGCER